MSLLPSSLIPETPTKAASAVNDKFCKDHPGLCSPDKSTSSKSSMSSKMRGYGASLKGLVSDTDPAKDRSKKQRAYGVGAAVLLVAVVAVSYLYMNKKKK